jgi:hypothetical protein
MAGSDLTFGSLLPEFLHPLDSLLVPCHRSLSPDGLFDSSEFPNDVAAIDDVERFQRSGAENDHSCAMRHSSWNVGLPCYGDAIADRPAIELRRSPHRRADY